MPIEVIASLMQTLPEISADATRLALPRSCDQTEAFRPYSVSLASRIASYSVRKVITGITGPNVSSCIKRML